MKRLLLLFSLLLCLLATAAAADGPSGLTASEFVERYNADIGEGFHAVLWDECLQDDWWFLSASDMRNVVAIEIDRASAENPRDCIVTAVSLKHKPRVSVGVFVNQIAAALAAAFPDVPEEERLAEAMRCLRAGDQILGLGYLGGMAPRNTDSMGQLVYEEEADYHTFLFSLPSASASP